MRLVILLVFASGCRWVLGLDEAITIDAANGDVILDADPSKLALTDVTPAILIEGTGTGGSRPHIVVIRGEQIVEGASVTLKGGPAALVIGTPVVSADGRLIAVPVTVPVMPGFQADRIVQVDVIVAQPTPGGMVMQSLPAAIALQGLDELTSSPALLASGVHDFSTVDVDGVSVSDGESPLVIRSRGALTIHSTVSASANGQTPGPGGGAGGDPGQTLSQGKPGLGPGAGQPSGGGAGFATDGQAGLTANSGGPATGLPSLPILGGANASSGGAGGNATGGPGLAGAGGGGGGLVELTAGGDLVVDTVAARGGNGGTNPHNGGGGSGGAVLVRGATVTFGSVDVSGGSGGVDGGAGSVGRVRVDATNQLLGASYRGAMFDADMPQISRASQPIVTVRGQGNTGFTLVIRSPDGDLRGPFPHVFGAAGTATVMIDEPLFRGLDTVCLLVDGAQLADDKPEGRNCIDVAFLP